MLGDNRAAALFNHVRALEKLQEVVDDARDDYNERKALCKEDGFDTTVVAAILKRRKNGEGQTQAFDELLREYENAIAEQKEMPLTGGQRGLDADVRLEPAAAMRGQRVELAPDVEQARADQRSDEANSAEPVDPMPAAEPLFDDDTPAVDRFENEGGKTPAGATEKDPF